MMRQIHHAAFRASQYKRMEKVMSNRILGKLSSYGKLVSMKPEYY